jgi:hypothetical protein
MADSPNSLVQSETLQGIHFTDFQSLEAQDGIGSGEI